MKHLLSGAAIAAALVIAAPVWTQTNAAPMMPSAAPSATSAPKDTMGSPIGIHQVKARHHRTARRGSGSDNIANQLNAQEVARNSGGGMAPAPSPRGMGGAPAPAYGGPRNEYGQPNQIYGMPGAGQPSASGPLPGTR
jgi:hypothetical protein